MPGPIKQSSCGRGPYILGKGGKTYFFLLFIGIPALMPTGIENHETGNTIFLVELYDFITFFLALIYATGFLNRFHCTQLFSLNCLLTQ